MKNLLSLNLRLIKFAWLLALVAVFGGTAFGATLTVTKAADTNDTVCNADCSLREAISAANAAPEDDTINFDPAVFFAPQISVLGHGDLHINNNGSLTINGPGANLFTLDGLYQFRVFTIFGGTANVTISGLNITKGNGRSTVSFGGSGGGEILNLGGTLTVNNSIVSGSFNSAGHGGGIGNAGTLILNNTIVRNNGAGSSGKGGGIYNYPGTTMTVTGSTISNNSSGNIDGGAVYNESNVSVNIVGSTVSGNITDYTAGIYHTSGTMNISGSIFKDNKPSNSYSSGGGSMRVGGGVVTITDSTFADNTARAGGGILVDSGGTLIVNNSAFTGNATGGGNGGAIANSGTLTMTNTTVSGNNALGSGFGDGGAGGGIANSGGTLTIINSTVANNSASGGGGVSVSGGTVIARNSIFADNTAGNGAQDFGGTLNSQGNNLIENTAYTTIIGTTAGNRIGQDAQLLPLGDYGGATKTMALLGTSPAVDAGNPANAPAADQRGIVRPQDGDLDGAALPDIGAYERPATGYSVTKLADTNDGACDADCSLREAIAAASAAAALDNVIVFGGALFAAPQTVTLTGGELQINNGRLAIIGEASDFLTISGNNQSRVFSIGGSAVVGISGVTITGGSTTSNGGGISNSGKLVVADAKITGNSSNFGGGIFNNENGTLHLGNSLIGGNTANVGGGLFTFANSNLVVVACTVSGNTAANNFGGGISNNAGTLTLNKSTVSGNNGGGIFNGGIANVNDSTISGNANVNGGGGIFNDALLNLFYSTVANNRSNARGGGILRNAGTINTRNTLVGDNAAPTAPDFSGTLNQSYYTLIENPNGLTVTFSYDGNITNQDPRLLPLGNYGGATQTHALRLNSPAIDRGFSFFGAASTDQRGRVRPFDFPNVPNHSNGNGTDIGAFERQPNDVFSSPLFDFDGDGRADVSVFRPSNGTWYLQQSAAGFTGIAFGQSEDKIVPADYDGDGKTDLAVFRAGIWYLQRSQAGFTGIAFGEANDVPAPADYDGDGRADIAVFRPSAGTWYLQRSQLGFTGITFGQTGDKPVAADYDGDGRADVAVFRPASGTWFVQRSQLGLTGVQFGEAADKPVPADYDGDGRADAAVFRPSNGTWYLQRSAQGFTGIEFGLGTDQPIPADYDGDGRADVAVFRNGTWYLQRSAQGFAGVSFGAATDRPIPNAYIP